MKDFFSTMFKKGKNILIFVFLVWFFYFLINFFSPNFFDFLRFNNKNNTNSTSTSSNISFSQKIYNIFFNNKVFTTKTFSGSSSSTEISSTTKKSYFSDNPEYSTWGNENNLNNFNNLSNKNTFILANTSDSPVQNLKINNILIDNKYPIILENGSLINGSVFTGYNDSYYFDIEIYNATGNKIFVIPANSSNDLKNKNYNNFIATYRKGYNYENYIGDGFLVIRSNNIKVEGILVVKIKIR